MLFAQSFAGGDALGGLLVQLCGHGCWPAPIGESTNSQGVNERPESNAQLIANLHVF